MALSKHQKWISDQLEATGVSQSELGRHLGLHASKINRITKGLRRVQPEEFEKAEAFFASLEQGQAPDQVKPINEGLIPIRVAGEARAGSYQQVDEFDEVEREEIFEPRDPSFPQARIVAFEVVGSSMNAAEPPIPSGSTVIGVDYDDLGGRYPLSDGDIVVVEQVTSDGQMREWSVKEVEIHGMRTEFHPRSTEKRYKPIVVNSDLEADDGRTVQVLALIRRVTQRVGRR